MYTRIFFRTFIPILTLFFILSFRFLAFLYSGNSFRVIFWLLIGKRLSVCGAYFISVQLLSSLSLKIRFSFELSSSIFNLMIQVSAEWVICKNYALVRFWRIKRIWVHYISFCSYIPKWRTCYRTDKICFVFFYLLYTLFLCIKI